MSTATLLMVGLALGYLSWEIGRLRHRVERAERVAASALMTAAAHHSGVDLDVLVTRLRTGEEE